MLKYDIILYMDCIRKTVFDAKLYLHIIKIEKQMLRKHAGQSGIPCSAYGSLERDAKPMTRGEMYMKKFVVAILAMAMLLVTMNSSLAYTYEEPVKSSKLPRSTPLEKGVNPSYLYDMLDQLEQAGIEMHSLLVSVDNEVIFEGFWDPYGPETPHIVHSLTKLFTNAAAGVAVTNGDLSLDDRLIDMFPELAPENPSENLQKVTLRYLITMNGGYGRMISGSEWRPLKTSWLEAFFAEPVPYEPGTHYQYSSGNAYAVSAMVQKATGKTCLDLLLESGFSELGMEHFTWDLSPEGICSGGNGVSCTTEDMLKVGNLFLNMGQWNGKQILTEEWCRMAIGLDKVYEGQGDYAFHWTDKHDGNYTSTGAYGQIVILVPELNMVVAGTAGTTKTNEEYNIINSAMIAPAKADKAMQETVAAKEQTLNLLQNPILTDSPIAEKWMKRSSRPKKTRTGSPASSWTWKRATSISSWLTSAASIPSATALANGWMAARP